MTLEARALTVRHGNTPAVDGASCRIEPAQLTAICGPNGAGKSSLASALSGLIAPDAGTVNLDGRPLASIPPRERARKFGFLPQDAHVAWDVSVATLASLGRLPWRAVPGRPARAARAQDHAAIALALSVMGLEDLADRPVSQLSGGERARAAMARVLAGQPDWIIADEPLASLDLAHQARLLACLRAEADAGRGVVVVVHDLAAAMNHADRAIVLDRGQVIADGAPSDALHETIIAKVWGVEGRWLGEPGARALAI